MDLESDYVVIMPIGRMRPVDGRTWEGKGVTPDIATPAGNALTAAQSEIRCLQR
jgi:C-terminal processing protease CtpA/Prc